MQGQGQEQARRHKVYSAKAKLMVLLFHIQAQLLAGQLPGVLDILHQVPLPVPTAAQCCTQIAFLDNLTDLSPHPCCQCVLSYKDAACL